MTTAMSKRQQARNEKELYELVRSVAGNNLCADCHTANPAWASWSLGVFLCMRCAAIHRKLGTHISKVKSLSMDSWSNEQVDNMRKVGNVASNRIYNSENKKPPVPIDADEVDSAMERFIRTKYINNVAASPGHRSPSYDEGPPPPLPPKNSTKFGFRSASSIFPLSSRSKKEARTPTSLEFDRGQVSPGLANKPSKVFGATVDYDGGDDTERKLARLRDMGFLDVQRNAIVLKGVNGDIDRAAEALVRLGEGDKRSPAAQEPPRPPLRTSRSLTPLTRASSGLGIGMGVPQKTGQPPQPSTPSSISTNPFDNIPPAQPQTAQSTGSLQTKNPYNVSTNPFGAPTQQVDLITQAFQSLDVVSPAQAQQPLFPHHTGEVSSQQPTSPLYSQPQMPPSLPATPQIYQQMGMQSNMMYPQAFQQQAFQQQALQQQVLQQQVQQQQFQQQQFQQQQFQQQASHNPFFNNASSSPVVQQPPAQQQISLNTGLTQPPLSGNPFARSPTRIASPTLGQIPEQFQATTFQTTLQTQMTGTNPFFSSPVHSPVQASPNPFSQQPAAQQQYYFQNQRPDKASIMALYSQAQLTPQQPVSPGAGYFAQSPTAPQNQPTQTQSVPVTPIAGPPARSATLPVTGSTNPFLTNGASQAGSDRKISRESMNLGLDMAWTNGRHSPDAFASLSARHV